LFLACDGESPLIMNLFATPKKHGAGAWIKMGKSQSRYQEMGNLCFTIAV